MSHLRGFTRLGQARCCKCPLAGQSGTSQHIDAISHHCPQAGDVVSMGKHEAQDTHSGCISVSFLTQPFAPRVPLGTAASQLISFALVLQAGLSQGLPLPLEATVMSSPLPHPFGITMG